MILKSMNRWIGLEFNVHVRNWAMKKFAWPGSRSCCPLCSGFGVHMCTLTTPRIIISMPFDSWFDIVNCLISNDRGRNPTCAHCGNDHTQCPRLRSSTRHCRKVGTQPDRLFGGLEAGGDDWKALGQARNLEGAAGLTFQVRRGVQQDVH